MTEAIALGHDLGHTPFGHAGERVLNEMNPAGFKHNEQSVRVAQCLEKNGQGLNLTWEVLDGMKKSFNAQHAAYIRRKNCAAGRQNCIYQP